MANGWQNLPPIQWGNLTLDVTAIDTTAARRLQIDEHPETDGARITDRKRAPRRVSMSLIWFSEGQIDDFEAFRDAADTGEVRSLTHPTFGSFPAAVSSVQMLLTAEVTAIRAVAEFVEALLNEQPEGVGDDLSGTATASVLSDAAAVAVAAVPGVEPTPVPAGTVAAGADVFTQAAGTVGAWTFETTADQLTGQGAAIVGQLDALLAQLEDSVEIGAQAAWGAVARLRESVRQTAAALTVEDTRHVTLQGARELFALVVELYPDRVREADALATAILRLNPTVDPHAVAGRIEVPA